MHRQQVFADGFTARELFRVAKYAGIMLAVEVFGHLCLRLVTQSTLDKHMGFNKNASLFKNKQLEEDPLV